jgi:hypothetical protein
MLRRPHRIPALIAMGRDTSKACEAAAAAAEKALAERPTSS